mmetsp:Transcript_23422/g.41096  ORF Transcript_23422/g.41096 Transcript_23422/m.41096 type:complete len:159 (+) Transcript_23422:3052-3528(+)
MVPRAALVGSGVAAAMLFGWVMLFSVTELGPALGCNWGPETRFWGYDADVFVTCFDPVKAPVQEAYRDVLTGADRGVAVALTTFFTLWALHLRVRSGILFALSYGLADLGEGVYLVKALDGMLSAVAVASALTMAKGASLMLAFATCILATIRLRRST